MKLQFLNMPLLRAEARAVRRAIFRVTHNSFSLIGLVATGALAWVIAHPEYAQHVGRWLTPSHDAPPSAPAQKIDPFAGAIADPTGEASRILGLGTAEAAGVDDPAILMRASAQEMRVGSEKDKQTLVKYLARKYRVNNDALAILVDAAYVTGKDLGMDPVLLLSVMAIESGFNPFAESTAGASGLMQVMSKVHSDKLADYGGENIALNPVANLRVGALVLKDCIRRGGSLADGLRLYVGAGNNGTDNGYGLRVLQEKDLMLQAVRGANAPRIKPIPSKVKPAVPEAKPDAEPVDEPKAVATL